MIATNSIPVMAAALGAALLALLALRTLWALYRSQRKSHRRAKHDQLDTVNAWMPEVSRVMTGPERRAYEILSQATPQHLVLAQVPLSRFLRVPARHSYSAWLQRVGNINADLLLCDTDSCVLAVIDMRSATESERARKRHDRMGRVLRAAGITVLVWTDDELPSVAEVRNLMIPVLNRSRSMPVLQVSQSKPLPLIPVAEMEELLAPGDELAQDATMEPVPSTLFDLLAEPAQAQPVAANAQR